MRPALSTPTVNAHAAARRHVACTGRHPMRFNVTIIDPPSFRFAHFLFDLARMIHGGLEELGHDVALTKNALEADRINVLVGIHHLATAADAKAIVDRGAPYVVYQTEIVTDAAEAVDPGANARRDEIVLPLCRGARAVWDSSQVNVDALAGHGVRAEVLRLGYADALREIRHKARKDIDFFFYGSLTPHRRAVCARLASLGYRVETMFDAASIYRNDLIARSEVVLTLRQNDVLAHLPHARLIYLVNNACLVAGDRGTEQESLEDVFVWGDPDEVIEVCRETRARPDRRELAEAFHAKLAQRRMKDHLEPLVESLGARG